ncbi:MAG: hypothetical protein P8Y02_14960 [Deinococcales bacterium]
MSEQNSQEALTDYWKRQLAAWQQSGQSQRQFCQTKALPYSRFLYWRRKLDRAAGRPGSQQAGGGFAQVAYPAADDTGLTLSLPNGLILRGIRADNVTVVRQLLDQL